MDTGSLTVHNLKPGALLFHNRSMLVRTDVGHGVVVTLYDRVKEMGAICHFAFPDMSNDETPTGLYAKPAIYYLVRLMKRAGSDLANIEATISGGASLSSVYRTHQNLAVTNIKVAEDLLSKLMINIKERDVGGSDGRRVQFNTGNGELSVEDNNGLGFQDWFPGFENVVIEDFPAKGIN